MNDTYYPYADDDGTDQAITPSEEFYKTWQFGNPEGYFDNNCAHCSSDQELTCNRKAYAAWWLWARIACWNDASGDSENPGNGSAEEPSGGGEAVRPAGTPRVVPPDAF